MERKVSQGPYETPSVGANFLLTSGSGSITRRVRSGAPSCKDSLMRHPPHSVLLVSDGPAALVPSAVLPVFSARGATAACTVGEPSPASGTAAPRALSRSAAVTPTRNSAPPTFQLNWTAYAGREPRGSAHQHRRGLGGPRPDAPHELPARNRGGPAVGMRAQRPTARMRTTSRRKPMPAMPHAPGVGGRSLRTPPGDRVKCWHEPGSSGQHLVTPPSRPGRAVVRRP